MTIETSDKLFEKKIHALLMHAYEADFAKDVRLKETYQNAYLELGKSDQYLLL